MNQQNTIQNKANPTKDSTKESTIDSTNNSTKHVPINPISHSPTTNHGIKNKLRSVFVSNIFLIVNINWYDNYNKLQMGMK
jgi:hypothetical protein